MDVFEKTKEDVADKVRKLLTQAEDPAATPEEAQTFTMKAQQLMSKYSIDQAMVLDTGKTGVITARGWEVPGPYANRKVGLVSAVARANECRAIYTDLGGGRRHIEVVGYPTDVDWVETLSGSLDIQLAGALLTATRAKPPGVHGRTFNVGFVQGFIAEIATRLAKARQQAIAEADAVAGSQVPSGGSSAALVLLDKGKRVEDEFKVRHPRVRTAYQSVRLQSWSGYAPGRAAGKRASLARGAVEGGRRRLSA
jgi:uncharacterized protein DUF2786